MISMRNKSFRCSTSSGGGGGFRKNILWLQPQRQLLCRSPPSLTTLSTTVVVAAGYVGTSFHTYSVVPAAAAAATGSQKRALQNNQLGPSSTTSKTTAATTARVPVGPVAGGGKTGATKLTPPPLVAASDTNNSILIGGAIAASLVAGGGYYYYNNYYINNKSKGDYDIQTKSSIGTADIDTVQTTPTPVSSSKDVVLTTSSPTDVNNSTINKNRVTSILVPSKMKNTITTATADVSNEHHPPLGNRVTNVFAHHSPPPPTTTNDTGTETMSQTSSSSNSNNDRTTADAIHELQHQTTTAAMESLIASHPTMWTSSSVSGMDRKNTTVADEQLQQLQQRIGQLEYELQDRTKWEAIRLKEFLIMKEKEVTDQYIELLQKQRLEYEDFMAKKLREQEHGLTQQFYQAMQEKESTIQNVMSSALQAQKQEYEEENKVWEEMTRMNLQSKLEDQFAQQLEDYKTQMTNTLQDKVRQMDGMAKKLQQLQMALDVSQTSKEGSLKAHRISAAALALAEKLEGHSSAKTELETLKLAAGNVGVISTACASLPSSVTTAGVPTLSELQTRFMTSVQTKCRQAAFVPKGRVGLEGQLAGMFFSTIRYAPSYDDVAPESDPNDAEYVLARASRHVQLGELETAVDELDKLTGQAAFVVADWKGDATDRVNVEKALKVIKMECTLLNESCLE